MCKINLPYRPNDLEICHVLLYFSTNKVAHAAVFLQVCKSGRKMMQTPIQ